MNAAQHKLQRHTDPHLARGHIGQLHMNSRPLVHLHHRDHGGWLRRGEKGIQGIGQQGGAAFGKNLLLETIGKATADADSCRRKLRFAAYAALPGEREIGGAFAVVHGGRNALEIMSLVFLDQQLARTAVLLDTAQREAPGQARRKACRRWPLEAQAERIGAITMIEQ